MSFVDLMTAITPRKKTSVVYTMRLVLRYSSLLTMPLPIVANIVVGTRYIVRLPHLFGSRFPAYKLYNHVE